MKKNKYKNIKVNGFDSKKEYGRYLVLKEAEKKGVISDLQCQPRYRFRLNVILICSYVADFRYFRNGQEIVEDVKSSYTAKLPVYRIKKKMMKAFYNIDVIEIF